MASVGNHFVEFGVFTVADDSLGFPPGEYLALLSHSGSRGTGAQVCDVYSKRAMARRSGLPKELGVDLLSAGLDEVPGVYKDIHTVMAAQTDLVEVLGRFDPKLVKMSPPGEKAED